MVRGKEQLATQCGLSPTGGGDAGARTGVRTVYSWRLDPRELGATHAATPDARRKHMRRDVDAQ